MCPPQHLDAFSWADDDDDGAFDPNDNDQVIARLRDANANSAQVAQGSLVSLPLRSRSQVQAQSQDNARSLQLAANQDRHGQISIALRSKRPRSDSSAMPADSQASASHDQQHSMRRRDSRSNDSRERPSGPSASAVTNHGVGTPREVVHPTNAQGVRLLTQVEARQAGIPASRWSQIAAVQSKESAGLANMLLDDIMKTGPGSAKHKDKKRRR